MRLLNKIASEAKGQSFVEIPELTVDSERGIESGGIIDNLQILYEDLNEQANLIDDGESKSSSSFYGRLLMKRILQRPLEKSSWMLQKSRTS